MTTPATSAQALAAAQHQSQHGPRFGTGQCQMRARLLYNVPSDGTGTASQWWAKSKRKHATTKIDSIPRGALVYWTGGSHGYGHVAIATGDGNCWSTDIRRTGYYDLVPIAQIQKQWGLKLVGWTEDIDGVVVWHAPAAAKAPAKKAPAATPNITAFRKAATSADRAVLIKRIGNDASAPAITAWEKAYADKLDAAARMHKAAAEIISHEVA